MRRKIVLFLAILGIGTATAVLPGCKTPTVEEKGAVDYGPRPDDYEQIIRDYLKTKLVDPASAIIEFRAGPKQLFQQETILRPLQYGWGVCVFVNDKNRSGAFDGFRPIVFYINNGKVIAANGGAEDDPIIGPRYARAGCKELGAIF
ncbi:MAG: hypothetical protein WBM28_08365 [Burkholderiales bacterium]